VAEDSKIINVKAKARCRSCSNVFSIYIKKNGNGDGAIYDHLIDHKSGQPLQSTFRSSTNRSNMQEKPNKTKDNRNVKISIRKKFNLALLSIMIISLLGTYLTSDLLFQRLAENKVVEDAEFFLTTIEAYRLYTGEILQPTLYKELPGKFVVEGMSSAFSSRHIFERIKRKYPEYYFKQAAPNPRHRLNLADEFELDIINSVFKSDPTKREWHGYKKWRDNKGKEFIIMKPIIAKGHCLKCHSVPEIAPVEVIENYGDEASFGWEEGDIIAALTVSVPAAEILSKATENTIILNIIVAFCFIVLIVVINLFFEMIVIKPINRLKKRVNEISVGDLDTPVKVIGNDELSDLANSFERMRLSVSMAISKLKNFRKGFK
jgi:HAMP domain-containing protein